MTNQWKERSPCPSRRRVCQLSIFSLATVSFLYFILHYGFFWVCTDRNPIAIRLIDEILTRASSNRTQRKFPAPFY